jgi:uncharacterized protein (TIGR03032 family)
METEKPDESAKGASAEKPENPPDAAASAPAGEAAAPGPPPLRSVHTASFPALLRHHNLAVFVTTYQAGKLVVLRAEGERLNTHFRDFPKPMGLAIDRFHHGNRLAVGTATQVWQFYNVPAVKEKLEPKGAHDRVYMPRSSHVTGDVLIHEMAWGERELWFVNTRFSCLCTLDDEFSFVPRWNPSFISGLAPEDRCHLNGLGMDQGRPSVVSALAVADTPGGWREHKRSGGVVIDLASGEIIVGGLSMPHSPRWYDGQLWILESGSGSLGIVDRAGQRYQSIASLPGFTRGLDFYGPLAFIGLSQVRESAVFSGIAIAERPVSERFCGVWVVDIRTGQTVAFVKFEDAVQEIFAVEVLPNCTYPDLINDNQPLIADSFVLPDAALSQVPAHLRSKST